MVVVAGEAGMVRKIFGGIDTGERAEIVNEVGLIEVSAIESDVGPTNRTARGDAAQNRLEATNAAEKFRGQADVMLEELDETARTEAGFVNDSGDVRGLRGVEKRFDGVFDGRMIVKHARVGRERVRQHEVWREEWGLQGRGHGVAVRASPRVRKVRDADRKVRCWAF